MTLRTILRAALVGVGLIGSAAVGTAGAQESPVRRVASIVSVAVEEYAKGVDGRGRLISAQEYQEAVDFLADARQAAERLPGPSVGGARALLDSVIAAVDARQPPEAVSAIEKRFAAALGSEGALELPRKAIDLREGQRIFAQTCAACHGERGLGDGPAARGFKVRPPSIGQADSMYARSPALLYRIVSVGIAGTPMVGFAGKLSPEQRWNVVSYLTTMRGSATEVLDGEGLYTRGCVSCHGVTGRGDGPLAESLSKAPSAIGSFSWQVERSDAQLAQAIHAGLPGTPMPPAPELTDAQVRSVVAYVRRLPLRDGTVATSDTARGALAASQRVVSLLEQSLTAARSGRQADAGDKAFDAYLAFEPIESPARARNPGAVATMERLFAEFKAAVRGGDLRGAERARDAIETGLPRVVELTRPTGSGRDAFWQSFLIIVREGFEAILVIGAIVAFLLKMGHREQLRSIWIGVVLALVASGVTAVVLKTILGAVPASSEIIEGFTLLVAVVVLFSVSYWLISRVEAAKWQAFIREKVTDALQHGGGRALAFVAFLAVYREGAETALFYQALFNEGAHIALPISLGIVVGFAALAVIFTLFYRFGVRIPMRPFFSVTSVLLYYMAFVFMGKGLRELQEGNAIPISAIPGFPTVDALGLYPTWQTLLGQLLLLALFVFALARTFWPKRSVALPTVPPGAPVVADVTSELAALHAENEALRRRLIALERTIAEEKEPETR